MVKDMKPGSVIIDLAAAGGGNCSLTKPGEKYTTENGVTIIGYTDLPARMGGQASSMYATNMLNMVSHFTGKEGADAFLKNVDSALADEKGDIIIKSVVCCKDGADVIAPPPPDPTPVKKKAPKAEKAVAVADPAKVAMQQSMTVGGASAALIASSLGGDPAFHGILNTFALSGAAGYQVVWGVTHSLHTPLMAVTNAISGLTAAGGLMLMGTGGGPLAQGLAYASVCISSVNIAGGFLVTKRMLDLFRKPGEVDYTTTYMIPAAGMAVAPFMLPAAAPTVGTVSGLMCIGALGGLSSQKTAQLGCALGMTGVTGAMAMTIAGMPGAEVPMALGLIGGGSVIGLGVGKAVSPMALPQTVAAFHALVGAAAVATCLSSYMIHPNCTVGHKLGAMLGTFIGGVTLTGSLVAFGKLNANLGSAPMNLPNKNMLNVGMAGGQAAMLALFCTDVSAGVGTSLMYATTALSSVMGVHLVGSVGGGDMPCCVTVLNSYSGWALVAEGMLLESPTLTVVGSLIGFSGAILTKIMCDAMNRDILNVIFGGMQQAPPKKLADGEVEEVKEHREIQTDGVASMLLDAKEVMIVPGYGMAVSQAQRAIGDIAATLKGKDINVRFSIHPVAGRMPGQMNVLLAEAGVPYEWVLEMDEVQGDMGNVDVCLVCGANDITNAAAETDEDCSIYGMPVIKVWEAKSCIFMKRSMAGGYADLENPVFFMDSTQMLLGDAKKSCEAIAASIKA
jgi:NAD(P) transhydrogenase